MSEFNRYYTRLERELRAKEEAEWRASFLGIIALISICGGLMWAFGIGF